MATYTDRGKRLKRDNCTADEGVLIKLYVQQLADQGIPIETITAGLVLHSFPVPCGFIANRDQNSVTAYIRAQVAEIRTY